VRSAPDPAGVLQFIELLAIHAVNEKLVTPTLKDRDMSKIA
jgi:hypothetical protein